MRRGFCTLVLFIITSCYVCQQQDVRDLVKTARELAKEPFTYLHRPRPLVPLDPINYPSLTIGSNTHYFSSTVGSSILAEYYDVRGELYLFLMLTCILTYDLRHLGELESI